MKHPVPSLHRVCYRTVEGAAGVTCVCSLELCAMQFKVHNYAFYIMSFIISISHLGMLCPAVSPTMCSHHEMITNLILGLNRFSDLAFYMSRGV